MGVEVMDRDEVAARLDTRPLLALGVLVLLIGAYEMRKHVPKQPHSRSAVVHAVDDLEISRHKHDGAQPDTENVRPGQRTTVTWEPRL